MTARIELKDLPPTKRREVAAQFRAAGVTAPAARAGRSAPPLARPRGSGLTQWRCHRCGETFTVEARAMRHEHDGRGANIEWLVVLSADQDGSR